LLWQRLFFDTITVTTDKAATLAQAEKLQINFRNFGNGKLGISVMRPQTLKMLNDLGGVQSGTWQVLTACQWRGLEDIEIPAN